MDGFEPCIASYVLKTLRFHNPRNPFPPTVQDVYELCVKTRKGWGTSIETFYLSGSQWRWPGPEPDQPGCFIPWPVVFGMLQERVAEEGLHSRRWTNLSEERFERIPVEAFAAGQRDGVIELRERYKAFQDAYERANELIKTLPFELRKLYWEEVREARFKEDFQSEATLLARAQASLESMGRREQ